MNGDMEWTGLGSMPRSEYSIWISTSSGMPSSSVSRPSSAPRLAVGRAAPSVPLVGEASLLYQ